MSIKTNKVSLKHATALATLLGCSALYLPLNAEAATASAKTSWAVSRVASESLGSYCTMAQKYSDDTVLTFAQNTKGEYSLALDFKDKKFTTGQKQSISVAIDGGKEKSFDALPQTENTVVLGIGKDADFIKQIQNAKKLTFKSGKDVSDFGLSEVAAGQKDLGSCIEAIQKPAEKPAEVAANASAEKIVTKSGGAIIRKNEVALKQADIGNSKEPSVEGLLAAMPKPSSDITPVQDMQAEIVPVSPVTAKTEAKDAKAASLQVEVASLRDENVRLSRALSEQRKSFEDKQLNSDGATVNELREKLDAAKAENQSLNNQVSQLNTKMSAKETAPKDNAETLKLTETVKALQQENQTLKNQIQIYANVKDNKSANTEALAKLQTENADLKQVIAGLKATPAPKETPVAALPDDEVIKLRADNRKLANDLELAKTEKNTFQTQVSSLQKDLEGKQLKMSGGSWDLEQATRRYQESQREIVRLGAILQSQDVKCANEKKDIEYMLFDPAIASKAQIAMLNSLEDQVKEKDEQLKSSGLVSAKAPESPDKDAKIAELQKTIADTQAQLADAQTNIQSPANNSKDAELASVKALLAQTQAQLANEQANAQKIDVKAQAQQSAEQAASTASLQMQIQQANQTIAQLQKQISASNQPSVRTASLAAVAPVAAAGGLVQQANFTAAPAAASAPVAAARFKSIEEFSNLLKNAGVSVRGSLQQVKGGDPASYRAYSWKTDSLYGSAEMKKVSDPSQFDATVDQYLSRAKSRCTGEFAAVPAPVRASNMEQSKAYEIACVGQSASSSASVLFTYGNQITTTIAHEGRAEAMDLAIDARDKISSKIN